MERELFFDQELASLAKTYQDAMQADVSVLAKAIESASGSSIIGVGSGGSFTVASLLCNLHETYTGRVSRPSTPLEIVCNPTLASSSPIFLISAEGKNPDIIEAARRARKHSARSLHVLTNREKSPLMDEIGTMSDVNSHIFNLKEKDGYLATNSLLFDAIVFSRAYEKLDKSVSVIPDSIEELEIGKVPISQWVSQAKEFAQSCVERGALTVVYSPSLKPIAVDIESKLSESALLYVQVADLRSYAHGRHLWLSNRPEDCAILALTEPYIDSLWQTSRSLFPSTIPVLTMGLSSAAPRCLISGLVAQMYLISLMARHCNQDIGRPVVPKFGRELYYANLEKLIPPPKESDDFQDHSKYEVLGARWPSSRNVGLVKRARLDFVSGLEEKEFRAIVFDYDGTLCSSGRKSHPPSDEVVSQLESLVNQGVIVGIASGRGGSIQECLSERLSKAVLPKIHLGLYNGGVITKANEKVGESKEKSEFLSHVTRLVVKLKAMGVPIDSYKATHPYQVSIRFREGLQADDMWFVVADALRQAGLKPSSIVKSKHSVDVLARRVNKSRLVAHIIRLHSIDPYQILTIGDQGAWPGNDSSLLEHKFSLSVDVPSRRLDRAWKLAPSHKRDVDATLWYLEKILFNGKGCFSFSFG